MISTQTVKDGADTQCCSSSTASHCLVFHRMREQSQHLSSMALPVTATKTMPAVVASFGRITNANMRKSTMDIRWLRYCDESITS
jgi:hypothetical protein